MTHLRSEQVLAVEDLPFGKLILASTYAIKVVKLCFLVKSKEELPSPTTMQAENLQARPPQATVEAPPHAEHDKLVFIDDDLPAPPSQQLATQAPPNHEVAIKHTPNTQQRFRVLSRLLSKRPGPTDVVPANSTTVLGCEYIEMPWCFTTAMQQHASFQDDLAATRLAAAAGIPPKFHGSCIVSHTAGALNSRLEYVTGLLTSCFWLRKLITTELPRFHNTSIHTQCPVGVIVTGRSEYRLGKIDNPAAKSLSKHAAALESQLAALHWRAVQHGLLLLDLHPNSIGVTNSSTGTQLTVVDWSRVINISLSKLAMQPGGQILCRFIQDLPRGLIYNKLERVLQTHKGTW
jgi:hypothetical protein